MRNFICVVVGILIMAFAAQARAVPSTFEFTGRLTTSSGPVSGNVTLTFTLFTQATGGVAVWTELRPNIPSQGGLVFVDLGAVTPLDNTVLANDNLFLEINVAGETLNPRLKVHSSPFSRRAGSADLLGTLAPQDVALATHNHDTRYAALSHTHSAADITAGTLDPARYSAIADLTAEGFLDNNAPTDLLTQGQADARFALSTHTHPGLWQANGTVLFSSDNVGIGTNAPATRFEVSDPGFQTQFRVTRLSAFLSLDPNTGTGASLIRSNKHVMLTGSATSTNGLMVFTNDKVSINQPFTFTAFGAEALNVNGSVLATAFTVSSSKAFKHDIKRVSEPEQDRILNKLMSIDVKHYRYTQDRDPEQRAQIGFIAEDLPPELLASDGKSVNVYNMLAYTVAAMKAQRREIDELKAELARRRP